MTTMMGDEHQEPRSIRFNPQQYQAQYGRIDTKRATASGMPARYLEVEQVEEERGFGEQLMKSTGITYLTGIAAGGSYGLLVGARGTFPHWKLRLNSMLNSSGRLGSRTGNTLGSIVLATNLLQGVSRLLFDNEADTWILPSSFLGCVAGLSLVKRLRSPVVLATTLCGTLVGAGYSLSARGMLPSIKLPSLPSIIPTAKHPDDERRKQFDDDDDDDDEIVSTKLGSFLDDDDDDDDDD